MPASSSANPKSAASTWGHDSVTDQSCWGNWAIYECHCWLKQKQHWPQSIAILLTFYDIPYTKKTQESWQPCTSHHSQRMNKNKCDHASRTPQKQANAHGASWSGKLSFFDSLSFQHALKACSLYSSMSSLSFSSTPLNCKIPTTLHSILHSISTRMKGSV